jgi:hypothetical protein
MDGLSGLICRTVAVGLPTVYEALPLIVQMVAMTLDFDPTDGWEVKVRRPVAVPIEASAFEFVEPSELVVPPGTDQVTRVVMSMVV